MSAKGWCGRKVSNASAKASLEPAGTPWIAWDDKLTGFGVRIQPSGVKSFIVNDPGLAIPKAAA